MSYTNGLDKPTDYFNTVIYTGNGVDDRDITGLDFQPDMLWSKRRDSVDNHSIYDSVRGDTKELRVQSTGAELVRTDNIQALNSNGFQVGTDSQVNASGGTYVSWGWLASNTTASNTDGSITSTVSANTTAGFSIVSFNGGGSGSDNIGHGLGNTPKIVLIKDRDGATDWLWYTTVIDGSYDTLRLNTTGAKTDSSYTAPTSSVFSFPANTSNNYIAYCFAEKKGFSKFGSYTGNGNADGTFVYTGLSPSFVLLKETSNANNWMIFDNKRSPFNLRDDFISPDIADAESTGNANNRMDMLSNGFKIRGTGSATNRSGSNFIFMAFAENPFVTSTGIPTTAR